MFRVGGPQSEIRSYVRLIRMLLGSVFILVRIFIYYTYRLETYLPNSYMRGMALLLSLIHDFIHLLVLVALDLYPYFRVLLPG